MISKACLSVSFREVHPINSLTQIYTQKNIQTHTHMHQKTIFHLGFFLLLGHTNRPSSIIIENYPKNCHNDLKWNIFGRCAMPSHVCKVTATQKHSHTHTRSYEKKRKYKKAETKRRKKRVEIK